ncbi:hypothetical protein SAMN05660477_02210 [Soonwooa buanensis]|uniref:Uncharacterized protein n=1 Tax=Soonwooa buanensis TaxID=619805 RepID=A0A1T5FQ20_9FLAO|nr:hypothetical protein [Soonwooa buanensis]SKB98256.1 hypothetical protein SAMN05660477_02210 [Soonwooa buanensis]
MKHFNKLYALLLLCLFGWGSLSAQTIPCNTSQKLIKQFDASVSATGERGLIGNKWSGVSNVVDNNLTNAATYTTLIGMSAWIEVESSTTFEAGSFAAFYFDRLDILSLGSGTKIETFLNGNKVESVDKKKFITTLFNNNTNRIGFFTSQKFNKVRITIDPGTQAWFTASVYYAEVFRACDGPALNCNADTNITAPTYPAVINPLRTDVSGLTVGAVLNPDNVVDNDNSNYATLTTPIGVLNKAFLSVLVGAKPYDAGTYAGFRIKNETLVNLAMLDRITIKTYLKGVEQESKSGPALLLGAQILDVNNAQIVGFVTSRSFDEVQIIAEQLVATSLKATQVYNLVLNKPCEGADLVCNTQTTMAKPNYPVFINTSGTGVTGLAGLATVINPENVVDSNTDNYASINLAASGASSGTLAVKKALAPYAAGTYAGFEIQSSSIFNAQFLQQMTVSTYDAAGNKLESANGNGLILGIGTDLLASSGRYVLGFVTTKAFSEVRITVTNLVGLDLGSTKIYKMVVMKSCPKPINCNSSYYWTQPDFPVVVNAQRTGVKSLACTACSVNSPGNIINSNPNDYSRIKLTAGVGNQASISVVDASATYPVGTFAGFTVKDRYFFVQGDLLEYITIKTYNDGVLQESKTSVDLIDLTLLIPIWGTGTKNIGFYTTKPFDEVQIVTGSISSLENIIDVYGIFIDTRKSNGESLSCVKPIIANGDKFSVKGSTGGVTPSVLANDTVNGVSATTSNVDLSLAPNTTLPAGFTLNADGTITVAPNTPAGDYTVQYQICEKGKANNCAIGNAQVKVEAPVLVATTDNLGDFNSGVAGVTSSILANDTYDGQPATTANVNIVLDPTPLPQGITMNPDGTFNVAANAA